MGWIGRMAASRKAVMISMLAFLTLLLSPFWLWRLFAEHELEVTIIDKTVPDASFREHSGLVWTMNQGKFVKSGGGKYSASADYYGYVPGENGGKGDVRELPQNVNADVIYVADAYGVYESDFKDGNPSGDRSPLVYGGLTTEETGIIRSALVERGGTLIAEFNVLSGPTSSDASQDMQSMLGLTQTGWTGRYFNDLGGGEVPAWVRDGYEKQTGKSWAFAGKGLLLLSDRDKIVVLDNNELPKGVDFVWSEDGKRTFGLSGGTKYGYWFDVVTPNEGTNSLAFYELNASEAGRKQLEANGIPLKFPAVLQNRTTVMTAYYFAGDYADFAESPSLYQAAGFPLLKSWLARLRPNDPASFHWKVYVPMVNRILADAKTQKNKAVKPREPEMTEAEGVKQNSRAGERYLQVYRDGAWHDLLIKGVNVGIAKPGHFPGETAITKQEYARWFRMIGEMNANTIRVYTLHPPAFYEALLEYNRTADKPLYVMHGVWVNEEHLLTTSDAIDPLNTDAFKEEIKRIVDVVHGAAEVPKQPGHAGGRYSADISPYMLGWMLGVEWDPFMVESTNAKHAGRADYDGVFFQTKSAPPFETWLAEMLDVAAVYENERYGWQRPMSFTNWVTTDLLSHPAEPLEKEDMVTVNPNVILPKEAWKGGYFAAYHVYPYYPDFMNYEKAYTEYIDHRGERNNYAGYLHDLRQAHKMPLLVAEFGVPSSRGLTHRNVSGWNQGFLSEKEQGEIDARLFEDIVQADMAGGLVFTWQDEWFKRTWNTMDYDNPDRRPFWSNAQTNEQHFGLLAFDPGKSGYIVQTDGSTQDWEQANIAPLYKAPEASETRKLDEYDEGRQIKALYAASDERYVYLRLDLGNPGKPLDWSKMNAYILIDSVADQGQKRLSFVNGGLQSEAGFDFAIQLKGPEHSSMLIDSYYDTYYYHYGQLLGMIPKLSYASSKDNGVFHPIRLTLNKELAIPGEDGGLKLPFDSYETGKLRFGNGNPAAPDYDSLTDVAVNGDGHTVEIRIPWLLLNVKDPSMHEATGDIWENGIDSSQSVSGLRFAAVTVKPSGESGGSEAGELADAVPKLQGGMLPENGLIPYAWKAWEEPVFKERLKQSYGIMQKKFKVSDVKK